MVVGNGIEMWTVTKWPESRRWIQRGHQWKIRQSMRELEMDMMPSLEGLYCAM